MEYKTAIIVDWENVRKRIFENPQLKKVTGCSVNYNSYVTELPKFFTAFLEEGELPYRIFIYTAEPFKEVVTKPDGTIFDFSKTPVVQKAEDFIKSIGLCDLTAVRKGRLAFRGWDSNKKPIFVQKKVDMLIGLDIAHLAYKKLVDRILVFSYDLDIQPALRVARLEGLQVILPILKELGTKAIPEELIEHTDFVRVREFKKLCNDLLASKQMK